MKVLTVVLTCSQTQDQADSCRKTWLRKIPEQDWFFYGDTRQSLAMENTWDCSPDEGEHRKRLPEKTYKMLNRSLSYDWDFLFKCDDDSYVVFDRVTDLLKGQNKNKNLYLGKSQFQKGVQFAQGGAGYVLGRESVEKSIKEFKKFYKDVDLTRRAEDYSVGLSLGSWRYPHLMPAGKTLGNKLTHCEEFSTPTKQNAEKNQNICIDAIKNGKATTHYVEPNTMKKIYDIFK